MFINYIGTAGIAVLIILVYYLTAYEPTNDPFERDGQSEIPFFPNPVDYHLLGWIRNGSRYISKRFLGPHRLNPRVSARLENTFIKVCDFFKRQIILFSGWFPSSIWLELVIPFTPSSGLAGTNA